MKLQGFGLLLLLVACNPSTKDDRAAAKTAGSVVRIGVQKASVLVLVKWRGTLEQKLAKEGVAIQWAEFPTGPATVEAINAGQLDLGFVGETPPVIGQAASPLLVYLATEPPAPRSEGILVPRDSPVRTVADLKGKTVALNKGSNVQYLLVQALRKAGLAYQDVKTAFLAPADALAAFTNGTVDAWAIWDPYLASAEVGMSARILVTAEGLANNHLFYVGSRDFADGKPELVRAIIEDIKATDAWVKDHFDETSEYLGSLQGVEPRAMRLSLGRATWGTSSVSDDVVASQQRIADTFLEIGLLASPLRIEEALPKSRF